MSDEEPTVSFRTADLRAGGDRAEDERRSGHADRAFEKAAQTKERKPVAHLEGWLGRGRRKRASSYLVPIDAVQARAAIKLRARDSDVRLKRLLAIFAVSAVGAQLAAADLVFVRWMLLDGDAPSDTVILAWLSATVVEVIGIVAIVARNLFPDKNRRESNGAAEKDPTGRTS